MTEELKWELSCILLLTATSSLVLVAVVYMLMSPPDSQVEILFPKVMALEGGAFGR